MPKMGVLYTKLKAYSHQWRLFMACNIEVYLMEQLLLFSYIKGSTTQFLPTMIYGDVIILHNEGLDKGGW